MNLSKFPNEHIFNPKINNFIKIKKKIFSFAIERQRIFVKMLHDTKKNLLEIEFKLTRIVNHQPLFLFQMIMTRECCFEHERLFINL